MNKTKLKKCEQCKSYLIPMHNFFMHEAPSSCSEQDEGISLEMKNQEKYNDWVAKYGKPEHGFNQMVSVFNECRKSDTLYWLNQLDKKLKEYENLTQLVEESWPFRWHKLGEWLNEFHVKIKIKYADLSLSLKETWNQTIDRISGLF